MFGRSWIVASDDFVYPGLQELVSDLFWLLVVIVVYATHNIERTCLKNKKLELYVLGCLVQLVFTLPVVVALVWYSSRGTILQEYRRRHVVPLLYTRCILFMVSAIWNILGSVWLSDDIRMCDATSITVKVILALVITSWLNLFSLLALAVIMCDPIQSLARVSSHDPRDVRISSLAHKLWFFRCRFLCCLISRESESSQALRDVAGHVATVMSDVCDLVPSDILAALILLSRQSEHQHQHELGWSDDFGPVTTDQHSEAAIAQQPTKDDTVSISSRCNLSPQPHTISTSTFTAISGNTDSVLARTAGWMSVANAAHYQRYAVAVYGCTMNVCVPFLLRATGMSVLSACYNAVSIVRHTYCCCCSCFSGSSRSHVNDNCCHSNTACFRALADVESEDILYVSTASDIYKVPFVVCFDHGKRSLVIAVRGTLSLADAITDLSIDSVVLDNCDSLRCHKGMWLAANHVYRCLLSSRVISNTLARFPCCNIVVTGHSLGAGTAVLLAKLIRANHADVQCFAFSPPGELVSEQLSCEMREYVMSVVTGDDLVPRLSYFSLQNLKQRIVCVLRTSSLSKYQLLYRACSNYAFGTDHSYTSTEASENSSPDHLQPLLHTNSHQLTYESLADVMERSVGCVRREYVRRLHLPGRILHVQHDCPLGTCSSVGECYQISWHHGITEYFSEIIVSKNMFIHHDSIYQLKLLQHIVSRDWA